VESMEINFVSPPLLLHSSLAIVGSSDLLSDSGSGAEIDSFEDVVRFNRAPTIGYENDVGSKTTVRVANNHVFDGIGLDPKEWPNQPHDFIKKLKNTQICYFGPTSQPWHGREKKADPTCELFRFRYEEMPRLKSAFNHESNKNFTVGVGFVCLCVASGIVPCLYGFDLEDRYRGHYYESPPPAGPCHDRGKEQLLLKKMLADCKIIIR